jgi:hypothetical protein
MRFAQKKKERKKENGTLVVIQCTVSGIQFTQ